jgi:alpha-tubulin suppressor-like RCC1 family protein
MRWLLLVVVTACGFSTRITAGDGDGGPGDGPDADPDAADGATQGGCRAVEIESMSAQNCVLRSDGEVRCWGRNEDGAIGVPSPNTCMSGDACVRTPTKVTLPEVIVQLGLGDRHSCAMSATKMYCWGSNSNGQFGDNSTNSATAPREIGLRAGATAVRGGDFHTCSLNAASVRCSGRNQFGEIGDMSTTQRDTPTAAGLAGVVSAIGAGFHHTCAIVGGAVSCWGQNTSAQVDTTGNTPVTSPRTVGVASATAVVGGTAHTCALISDGSLRCWGANTNGQLGVGDTSPHTGPQTLGLTGVSQLVAGANHSCALAGTGVWCWGEGYTNAPAQINFGGAAASAVSAGSYHDCAIMTDGTVRCWGVNSFGQLGNNSTQTSATPVQAVVCP